MITAVLIVNLSTRRLSLKVNAHFARPGNEILQLSRRNPILRVSQSIVLLTVPVKLTVTVSDLTVCVTNGSTNFSIKVEASIFVLNHLVYFQFVCETRKMGFLRDC